MRAPARSASTSSAAARRGAVLAGDAATRDAQAPPGAVALRVVAPVAGADGAEVVAAVKLASR